MHRIKLFCMDVDGTLTDGKIYMGSNGEVMKAFDIKDGYGIHEILPKHGIVPVIITGRTSRIVENRARELGIAELHQGAHEKLPVLETLIEKYGCSWENVAYVGDDVLDLECMETCGLPMCPADAVDQVKKISAYVAKRHAGDGAVREMIEWMIGEDAM